MILMNDFKAEPGEIRVAMLAAVQRVLESGWYVLGKEVEAFEKKWADLCGVSHAVGVGNGMDAIEISLRSLGIGPGDEVITTPMTAFATVLAIMRAGARPVLADIDPVSALLSVESAKRCLSPSTRAVVLVHLYGQIRDMDRWVDFTRGHKLHLIEDCAQAHIASWKGNPAGSFGVAGAFSFYPTKNLGTPGDGGMLVTNTRSIAELASRLRNYGQSVRYHHEELGLNSRLDEVHAAMLSARLPWLQPYTARRREIAARYRSEFRNGRLTLLAAPQEEEAHVYHLFCCLCDNRDAFLDHMQKRGVQTLVHYPIPIHKQPAVIGKIGEDPQGLPAAENHGQMCVSIPCHPQMLDSDVDLVIEAVNSF